LLDSVKHDRTLPVEDEFVRVRIETPSANASAGAQTAKGIRQPGWDKRQIVEAHHPTVVGRNHQVAFVLGRATRRRSIRIDHLSMDSCRCGFAASGFSVDSQDCVWPSRTNCVDEAGKK